MLDIFGVKQDPGRKGAWIQTSTGRKFYPLDPRPEEVSIRDIAHGLSLVCRYGAQCARFYSVAEHSLLVAYHVPRAYRREALLHDAAEAYIGDMVRPLKYQPEMYGFRECERAIEHAIFGRFGIDSTEESRAAIKEIDDRIIIDEVGDLMPSPVDFWTRHPGVTRLDCKIVGYDPATAEEAFAHEFRRLFPSYRE